jgi:hypothetical protein
MNKHKHTCIKCGYQYNILFSSALGSLIEVDELFLECSRCGEIPDLEDVSMEIQRKLDDKEYV